jgi:hypothetical protein
MSTVARTFAISHVSTRYRAPTAAMVKGFGRRPLARGGARHGEAGVRKPPIPRRKPRSGKGAGAARAIYGDLRIAGCRRRGPARLASVRGLDVVPGNLLGLADFRLFRHGPAFLFGAARRNIELAAARAKCPINPLGARAGPAAHRRRRTSFTSSILRPFAGEVGGAQMCIRRIGRCARLRLTPRLLL